LKRPGYRGNQDEKIKISFPMKKFLVALQFLTIIPVKKNMTVDENLLVESSSVFVIVGAVQGVLLLATDFVAGKIFNHDFAAGITLLVLVLSTGGFHLDGLADTFDALAARGDREKKLSVMKDGRVGPIGATAIFFVLLFKFLALNNLSAFPSYLFYSSLLLMPIFSKWSMVISMFYGAPAKKEGTGKIFIGRVGVKQSAVSTLLLLFLFFIVPEAVSGGRAYGGQYIFYAISMISMYLFCRISISFFEKKFNGLTGDTLGAISEITEVLFLFMVIGWSQLFI
jgi:adenosylcobinamide-GDP ribazoletransferase